MTSLADAYDRRAGEVSRRRLYLGTGVFGVGAALVVLGIVLGTTAVLPNLGFSKWAAREAAGLLAGLGIPAVFVGIFAVLPAGRVQRAAAAIGASLAVLGVMLFRYAYPDRWYDAAGMPSSLTLLVVGVYFIGTITTFWCLFTAVATFKRRNDPGGTVALTVTRGGETRTIEVAESSLDEARKALGGVAVFGGVDDPDDADHPAVESRSRPANRSSGTGTGPTGAANPASDGGATTQDISSPLDDDSEFVDAAPPEPTTTADRYCGNCAHFEYVRTEGGIRPYCGFYSEVMDDVEACDRWEPNN